MSFNDTNTITAPRIAVGRYWIGSVSSSRISPIAPKLTTSLTWLVARIESLTAVRDPLVPIGMPW